MSDFVFDGSGLPSGKVDARPLTGNPANFITAAEWNSLMQAVADLRDAVLTGDYHGLTASTAEIAASGYARIRHSGNKLEASVNGRAFQDFTHPGGYVNAEALGILPSNTGSQNSDAMEAAFAAMTGGLVGPEGWHLLFGFGRYEFARTINVVRHCILQGIGGGGGQASTRFRFPAGTTGMVIHSHESGDAESPVGASNRGDWSQIRDIMLESTYNGGTVVDANGGHAIFVKGHCRISNVYMALFKGDGIHIRGASGDSPGTNANNFFVEYCKADNMGGHGYYVDGADANAGVFIMCDATANAGYGFFDSSFLGNTYIACHTDSNVTGSYGADDANARNVYLGCYVEGGQAAPSFGSSRTVWLGGLCETFIEQGVALRDERWNYMSIAARGNGNLGIWNHLQLGSKAIEGQQAYIRLWNEATAGNSLTLLYNPTDGTYDWYWSGTGETHVKQIAADSSSYAGRAMPGGSLVFPSAFFLGAKRVSHGTAAPSTGTHAKGDICLNTDGDAGERGFWYCTVGGTPGTWECLGTIGAGWYDKADIDLTAQPTQTIGSNGAVTIAGEAFTKINSANEDSAMVLTNGVGLVITPKGGGASDYYSGRTLPALTYLLNQIPGFHARMPLRMLTEGSGNFGANYDALRIAFETPTADRTSYIAHRGHNGGNGVGVLLVTDGNTRGETYKNGAGVYDDSPFVLALDMPNGIGGGYAVVLCGTTEANMVPAAVINVGTPTGILPSVSGLSDWMALIGAMKVNSATALVVTLTRWKLSYYRER